MAATATPTNNNQEDKAVLLFEFEEKVYPGVTIADSEGIRLIWDEKDAGATVALKLQLNHPTLKK